MGNHENLNTLAISVALLSAPFVSFAQEASEGRELAATVFDSMDSSERGFVDMGQFNQMSKDIFVSMDTDEDGKLVFGEFTSWDFGFIPLAEEKGRASDLKAAQRIVFGLWDRNGDGEISQSELQKDIIADYQRADTDGDGFLTKDEFLHGFIINIAYRSAINPESFEE